MFVSLDGSGFGLVLVGLPQLALKKNSLTGGIVAVAGGQDIPIVMTDTDSVQTSLTFTVILKL